eukprot:5636446-Pleurochrysis_carterae.AAC.1
MALHPHRPPPLRPRQQRKQEQGQEQVQERKRNGGWESQQASAPHSPLPHPCSRPGCSATQLLPSRAECVGRT